MGEICVGVMLFFVGLGALALIGAAMRFAAVRFILACMVGGVVAYVLDAAGASGIATGVFACVVWFGAWLGLELAHQGYTFTRQESRH